MATTTELPIQVTTPWQLLPARMRLAAPMDDDALLEFCAANRDLRIERAADGELLIMAPTGADTGRRGLALLVQLGSWAERDGTGVAFDSNAGFSLANGAMRAPDGSWLRRDRWDAVPVERRDKFVRVCPDFVIELSSPSDRLKDVKAKMVEYIANGATLGWLVHPGRRIVWVYQADGSVTQLDDPSTVSGDPLLPGFVLDLAKVW